MGMSERKVASWPLLLGALVGLSLGAVGLIRPAKGESLPQDAVATVHGVPIARADFERALAAVRSDARNQQDESALRHRVLQRLIEEQLLVSRALELGLAERDPQVRGDLSQAMLDLLVARGEQAQTPSDDELRRFYTEHGERFRTPGRVKLAWTMLPASGDARATLAAAGELRERWARGDDVQLPPPPLPLPDGWLPVSKLPDYLGATLSQLASSLAVGAVSEPWQDAQGVHLLRVVDREPGAVVPFEQAREQVTAAWLRDAGERRLRAFFEERRDEAHIEIAEGLR
jgi:PPIC-type PPIASE domain/SurA-like N-terminal domain